MEAATARLRGAPAEPGPQRTLDRLRSDRRLAERYQAGDEAAFARLYERHRSRVFAICLGVLGSREDAQDALQEVFASVAAELRRNAPRELRPWIARVARNAAIDAARTRRPPSNGDEEAMDERASDGTLQTVERRDDLRDLLRGLRDLPEQQRTALVLRELGGDFYADIGATLGIDETAVRGLIARARLSLRARIAAQAMACEVVRQQLAAETDGRHRTSSVRRHMRECDSCRAFSSALKSDARTLRGLAPTGAGFGLLALLAAWRGPKAVVAGSIVAKGALSSGAAQVAVVCVAAVCAVGGAEQLVEQQRHHSETRSASASATPGQPADNAAARTGPTTVAGASLAGGAALRVVSRALDRAGVTGPAGAERTTAPAKRRATVPPARDRPAATRIPRREAGAGSDRVQRFGGQNGGGRRDGNAGDRADRQSGGGDRTRGDGAGGDGPVRDQSFGGGGDGNRGPSLGGSGPYSGSGQIEAPEFEAPQVTAPAPVEAPVPTTGGDGS